MSQQSDEKGFIRTMEIGLELIGSYPIPQLKCALETLDIFNKNLIEHPDEKKYRQINISNIHFQERLGGLLGATECLNALGYFIEGDFLVIRDGVARSHDELVQLRSMVAVLMTQMTNQWEALPARHADNYQYRSVEGAGAHSEIGPRDAMEDDDLVVDQFMGVVQQGFFALYDGHGGREVVDFVVKALHLNLKHILHNNPDIAPEEAQRRAYLETDGQLRRQNILHSGCTAVTTLLRVDERGVRTLHCANVGDSRAVLARSGRATRLTIDHKATLLEEKKRIEKAGGAVYNGRVMGSLALSRALGDHMSFKESPYVLAEPYCLTVELDTHEFLILACDGVWDVMTDQEAVDFVVTEYSRKMSERDSQMLRSDVNLVCRHVAAALVRKALDPPLRSEDNVSVVIIKL